ncbi:hypothetical protein, partial [Pseudorhodobacter sp.]|uniref:hypothetical protein n=1 Tax=Pseudorhodobacter sp. TaxID=1934400 RepID=UPI00264942F5
SGSADEALMCRIRSFLIVLLTLLMLPWGAYLAGPVSAAGPEAVAAIGHRAAAQITTKAAERLMPLPKSCRIAVLPGSPCGPDLVLPVAQVKMIVASGRDKPLGAQTILGHGRAPMPSRDPPRMV